MRSERESESVGDFKLYLIKSILQTNSTLRGLESAVERIPCAFEGVTPLSLLHCTCTYVVRLIEA
jgi:hypothetical protein